MRKETSFHIPPRASTTRGKIPVRCIFVYTRISTTTDSGKRKSYIAIRTSSTNTHSTIETNALESSNELHSKKGEEQRIVSLINGNSQRNVGMLTFAKGPSGIFPFHRSSTAVILSPFASVWIFTTLPIIFSVPRPLTLYLVFRSRKMGFPASLTSAWSRS